IVDAAVETSAAGIARDVPPLIAIREAVGLPTQALWVNRAERTVQLVPFAAEGWLLSDYRKAEQAAAQVAGGWNVRVIPPVDPRLFVAMQLDDSRPQQGQGFEDAVWAIQHWGVQGITVGGYSGGNASEENKATALALAEFAVAELAKVGIRANATVLPTEPSQRVRGESAGVEFEVVRSPKREGPKP
ncbi:MAG TPA: hypothetical protein PKC48_12915, partial [Sphingorhabdus sp.]|nr:hypothetical protein [Sphingorhabdus sp.]